MDLFIFNLYFTICQMEFDALLFLQRRQTAATPLCMLSNENVRSISYLVGSPSIHMETKSPSAHVESKKEVSRNMAVRSLKKCVTIS